MLDWYNHLYIGDNARKKAEKYMKNIEKGKPAAHVYLITLAANGVDQLDIISSYYLLQNTVYGRCPMIVGIAKGYDEALELLLCMLKDTLELTGTANIKEYLLQR